MGKDYPASGKKSKKAETITEAKHQQDFFNDPDYKNSKYKVLHPKNDHQRQYLESLATNNITIAIGPPGTAKTLLALYYGFVQRQQGNLEKIYYLKPHVGCSWERDIGATPGTLKEKLGDVLLDPVKDNLPVFMSAGEAAYHLDKGTVEAKLFANIRGATFRDCLVLLDEAQNLPPEAVKTFLTRLGSNCTMVICGDPNQQDVKLINNGLLDCAHRLYNLKGVGIVEFTREDVVRHGLIKHILDRYET